MKKFNLHYVLKERYTMDLEIEAASEEEAEEKANQILEKNENHWNSSTDFSYVDRSISFWISD